MSKKTAYEALDTAAADMKSKAPESAHSLIDNAAESVKEKWHQDYEMLNGETRPDANKVWGVRYTGSVEEALKQGGVYGDLVAEATKLYKSQ